MTETPTPGSVQRDGDMPEAHPLDLSPSGSEADAIAEAKRMAENERFKIWEDGYMAGLVTVNGGHRKNPYQWHGLGFMPKAADIADLKVRVFLGGQEITVLSVGTIIGDRFGTRIENVFIRAEPNE